MGGHNRSGFMPSDSMNGLSLTSNGNRSNCTHFPIPASLWTPDGVLLPSFSHMILDISISESRDLHYTNHSFLIGTSDTLSHGT